MMKNTISMNFMLFIGFLVMGYSVSTKFYHPTYAISGGSSLSIATTSNSIQSLNNGQRNILLILVDTLDPTKANLESIWLLTNLPPDATLHVFPIYPTGSETITKFEKQLPQSFKLDEQNDRLTIDQDTIGYLEDNNYWWSGYFIIDSNSLPKILDTYATGEDFGEIIYQDEFVSDMDGLKNDPQTVFAHQLALMQNICHRLSGIAQNSTSMRNILTDSNHLVSNLEPDQLEIELKKLIENRKNLNCTFPTLEISHVNK